MTDELEMPRVGEVIRLLADGSVVGQVILQGYHSGPPHGPTVVAVTEGHTDVRLRRLRHDTSGWYVTIEP
jgi:hypothetical protein